MKGGCRLLDITQLATGDGKTVSSGAGGVLHVAARLGMGTSLRLEGHSARLPSFA